MEREPNNLRRMLELSAGDPPLPFLDADGLILIKSKSSRPQDRFDVEALRRLREA